MLLPFSLALLSTPMLVVVVVVAGWPFFSPETLAASAAALPEDIPFGSSKDWEWEDEGEGRRCGRNKES